MLACMQVPLVLYQMSATAFFTALVLNLTSFLFEDSAAKRQLAMLSCIIKVRPRCFSHTCSGSVRDQLTTLKICEAPRPEYA